MLELLAFALLVIGVPVCLMFGVVAGGEMYVNWRHHKREGLRESNPIAYLFLGRYQSPFPWHIRDDE